MENKSLIKEWGALLPLIMSLLGITLVLGHALLFGNAHEADEGMAAHIFQLLMALQVPIVAIFIVRHLPHAPKQTLRILALQASALFLAFTSVFFFT